MTGKNTKPTGCCPIPDPTKWDKKQITWNDEPFVKDHVTSFMHMPLNMGKKIAQNTKLIEEAGAQTDDYLMLSDEKSLWGSDIYIHVTKDVPNAEMAKLSGTYFTKAFEGPYKDAGKWVQEMTAFLKDKGKEAKKIYFYYTTCPKCMKAYGKNYVILFAQVA